MIQLSSDEIPESIRRVVSYLVPRFTKKAYLLAEPADLFQGSHSGLTVVADGQKPSNFIDSFRLILRPGEMVVVSSTEHRFSKEHWRELAEQLSRAQKI